MEDLREKFIAQARAWIGRKEADESHRVIIDAYNDIRPLPRGYRMSYTDPWCAAFVSAVGFVCGMQDIIFPECACGPMIELYKRRGEYHSNADYGVKKGDIIFYDWDRNGSSDHVGIVEAVNGTTYTVIEGNMSDAVGRRTIPKGWLYIIGFAAPAFDSKDEVDPVEPGEQEEEKDEDGREIVTAAVPLPVLARGDINISVLAMQAVLIARGFGCGPDGADGNYGANTESAVKRFQRHVQISDDGICGPDTWRKLIGG